MELLYSLQQGDISDFEFQHLEIKIFRFKISILNCVILVEKIFFDSSNDKGSIQQIDTSPE